MTFFRSIPTIDVLGIKISVTNMENAIQNILRWVDLDKKHYVCLAAVHGVMESQKDRNLRAIYNEADLTVPDGMPLVWVGRLYGHAQMGRVYGPDLMLQICRLSVSKGYTHFLYGGNIGVADLLRSRLEREFSGIRVVGTFTPPFRLLNTKEREDLKTIVRKVKPDLFWVGLGCPKQELFMSEYLPHLDTKVMLGVGAAFDFHTGKIKEAPNWIKNIGMQWLHRLCQEPLRLWWRYLYNNPLFVYKILKQIINTKR